MLDTQTRAAVLKLHEQGHGSRKIAEDLGVSRNSVRAVIATGSVERARLLKPHGLEAQLEDIRSLYSECKGNVVRVAEELEARHQVRVPYSTLTRFCRAYKISRKDKEPVLRIQTGPGEEMQHDTSPYTLMIGGKRVKRHCASLVLGYSRKLYIQFYAKFDRFHCKIFLSDAFEYMGGVCSRCVIDNTHVVIACGTGSNAQVSAEMEAFEKRFHFQFLAHALGHANRSGKVERPFRYIEGNFLAGRRFKDDADLNRQALEWLEHKADVRRLRELGASPRELFADELPHLRALPLYIPEVYKDHPRNVDDYGYVSLHRMRYSVPRDALGQALTVRETKNAVLLLKGHDVIATHPKLTDTDSRSQSTLPGHQHRPHRLRPQPAPQEQSLKAMDPVMAEYLSALKAQRGSRYSWALKKLYALSCQYKSQAFVDAVRRAARYRLFDMDRIQRLLLETLAQEEFLLPLDGEDIELDPEYQKGAQAPPVDLSPWSVELPDNPQEEEHA